MEIRIVTESQSPRVFFATNYSAGNSVHLKSSVFFMEVPPTIAAIFDKLDPPMRERKLSNADALMQLRSKDWGAVEVCSCEGVWVLCCLQAIPILEFQRDY